MINDLTTLGDQPELSCDVCIVGSGAAGLALASELMSSSLRTIILESGGLEEEPPTQALYDVDISGLPHPGSTQGRFRICGGSTTRWGGQALPLMPSDFERRDWIPHSGWPISFEELTPYYARAAKFLEIDSLNFDTELFVLLRTRPPNFNEQRISYHFAKWGPRPNVRERYLPGLAKSNCCTLLLHANVVRIALNEELNQVDRIEVRSLDGARNTVRARVFVLCVGGIETARLLLANDQQHPNGIGNQFDLVGRFFQDHPSAMVGRLNSPDPVRAQKFLQVFHKNRLKYSVRCTATPLWQREQETLNISMGTTFEEDGPALQHLKEAYVGMRERKINGAVAKSLLRAASHPVESLLPVWHFLANGRSFAPGARMRIGVTSEQEPNPESRILLSRRTDALGIRCSNVRWKLTDRTLHTIRRFAMALRQEFGDAKIGDIELEQWITSDSQTWTDSITDQFHHIGTARMNDSPRLGVVERNCRVHGIENLYIGSSAVFPTGGHSNPTLTIIALCLRLADHLKMKYCART